MAAALFATLFALRFAPPEWRGRAAVLLGVAVWVTLLKSGIDPVIAGLAVGLITSSYPPARVDLERVVERTRSFREQPTPELARSAQLAVASAISPNDRLQHRLHPWTSFAIVPLFALANAGIHVDGSLVGDAMSSPVTLGIFFGYVLGKPLGIVGASWLAWRLSRRRIRLALSWPVTAGGGTVAGIGFTVSLLISSIAFDGRQLEEAKLGLLASAIVSSLIAWGAFRLIAHLPAPVRARQLSGTAEELLDLSEDVDPARDHVRGSGQARSRSSSTATTSARTAGRRRSPSASWRTPSATTCATSGATFRSTTCTRTPRWRPRPPRRPALRAPSGTSTTGC